MDEDIRPLVLLVLAMAAVVNPGTSPGLDVVGN